MRTMKRILVVGIALFTMAGFASAQAPQIAGILRMPRRWLLPPATWRAAS
jgi:hypothetical protein